MFNVLNKERLLAIAFIFIALILLTVQNPPFFFLLPILLLTFVVSWYLYKEIKHDNEESLKLGIHYMQEEAEAKRWLHKSFVPKARKLARKELRNIILACGAILLSFIFLWSFFVSGLLAALLNTLLCLLFFIGFIIYTLYAPKEFTRLFKHVPQRYRHHSKNDWVHAYLLLLPFAVIGYFLYSLTTTGEGTGRSLYDTLIFLFSYTFLYICIYCLWFLYQEYQREQKAITENTARKIMKEQ
jgi:uncharacterized membrane protein